MPKSIGNGAKTEAWVGDIVHLRSRLLKTGQPQRSISESIQETRLPGGNVTEQNSSSIIQRTVSQSDSVTKQTYRVNVQEVASKVYRLMQLELKLERERSAK